MKINRVFLAGAALLLACGTAHAQALAPTPKKAPRTPVNSEVLTNRAPVPVNRVLEGTATILDAERLKINGYEVRLFGVVPPHMGASYGPQARKVVDTLAQGNVTCRIKDRDRDGRLLALCHNDANADFGLELLRRGLAATARGSLGTSEYAGAYTATEQAAQNQRLGIWSANTPAAVTETNIREAAQKAAAAKAELERLKNEEAAAKAEAEALAKSVSQAEALQSQPQPTTPPVTVSLGEGLPETSSTDTPTPLLTTPLDRSENDLLLYPQEGASNLTSSTQDMSFVERYQLLITGLLFLCATFCGAGAIAYYRIFQKREDIKSIAAALRGELMAARSICQARLAKIAHDGNERGTRWPRIRTLVFQAYVGRLGLLGADLSRQIASIYGQTSDYASYYNTNDEKSEGASKRQALESLISHIEEVTPRLSRIEKRGKIYPSEKGSGHPSTVLPRSTRPIPLPRNNRGDTPPSNNPGTPQTVPPTSENDDGYLPTQSEMTNYFSDAKSEIVSEQTVVYAESEEAQTPPVSARPATKNKPAAQSNRQVKTSSRDASRKQGSTAKARPPLAERVIKPIDNKARSLVNFTAPILEKLSMLKTKATQPLPSTTHQDPFDFTIPDYANLTEEELEALINAEEEMLIAFPVEKSKMTG